MNLAQFFFAAILSIGFTGASLAQTTPPEYQPLTPATRAAIVDSVAQTVIDKYAFPDQGLEMAKLLRRNLKKGNYNEFTILPEFTEQLTTDLRSISHDLHLHVDPMPPEDAHFYRKSDDDQTDPELFERRLKDAQYTNFGFDKVERMNGNIGYIKLNRFVKARYAGMTAVAAMNFIGYCDALIFDVRDNGGGSPSMIQLLTSYLFDEPEHLNNFYVRDDAGDYTEQYWTQAYVTGPRLAEIPVYVLTSSHTFSAAEEFTYNLKNMKRATIVGDTTRGGAHPVKGYGFPDLLVTMSVPYGRAINPISKTNWEGVGVTPDIPCDTDDALQVAQLDALRQLRDTLTDDARVFLINWEIESIESALNPASLTEDEMQVYIGKYDPRRVFIENGSLIYQRGNADPHRLIPLKQDWFIVEDLDYFRIGFEMGADGRAAKIIGLYNSGDSDENERTE